MISRVFPWGTNAKMIFDVAKLGYLGGWVCDLTYGRGSFWRKYYPAHLTGCDLVERYSPIGFPVDFRHTPFADQQFDSVVLDAPYRLNGRPNLGEFDERYGLEQYTKWQGRMQLIKEGITEGTRISKEWFMVKCQDQVVSGKIRWQTTEFAAHAELCGFELWDRFDMFRAKPSRQPAGRLQLHTHNNTSSLLILRRTIRAGGNRGDRLSKRGTHQTEDPGGSSTEVGSRGDVE